LIDDYLSWHTEWRSWRCFWNWR